MHELASTHPAPTTVELHTRRIHRDAAFTVCCHARAHDDVSLVEDARELLAMLGLDPGEARATKGALYAELTETS